ncbi:MAG: hypothetical protein J1E38_05235 [Paramuribaculum sp.]|nr:hypothetical protein [Paramuribaculum sp.]
MEKRPEPLKKDTMDPFKRIDEKLNSILVAVENNGNRKIDFNPLEVSLNRKFNNIPEQVKPVISEILTDKLQNISPSPLYPGSRLYPEDNYAMLRSMYDLTDSHISYIAEWVRDMKDRKVPNHNAELYQMRIAISKFSEEVREIIHSEFIAFRDELIKEKELNLPPKLQFIMPSGFTNKLKYLFYTYPIQWLKQDKVLPFAKQFGVILLSIFTAILLFLVILLANDNNHLKHEYQYLKQIEPFKFTAPG